MRTLGPMAASVLLLSACASAAQPPPSAQPPPQPTPTVTLATPTVTLAPTLAPTPRLTPEVVFVPVPATTSFHDFVAHVVSSRQIVVGLESVGIDPRDDVTKLRTLQAAELEAAWLVAHPPEACYSTLAGAYADAVDDVSRGMLAALDDDYRTASAIFDRVTVKLERVTAMLSDVVC